MKALVVALGIGVLLLIATIPCRAQIYDSIHVSSDTLLIFPTIYPGSDSIYLSLNTAAIPTGILIDKILPFSNLQIFKGSGTADSVVDFAVWSAIQADMFNGSSSPPIRLRLDTLQARVKANTAQGIVPIGILNMGFNWLDSNAIGDTLIYLSGGRFHDVLGRTHSPYDYGKTFAASFLSRSSSDTLSFVIDTSQFLLTNTSDTLLSFRIDFGDGHGYQTYKFDTVYHNVIIASGSQTCNMQAIFKHDTLASRSSLAMPAQVTGIEPQQFLDVTTSRTYAGLKGRGSAWVVYGCGHASIQKPLIFVTGFDPTNDIEAKHYYENYFEDNLETKLSSCIGPPDKPMGTVHRQVFKRDDGSNTTLGEELYKAGYDVIIILFGPKSSDATVSGLGGGDYIERNAYVVEDIIQDVNTTYKVGNAENIVVGASMGGLIARYALTDMEYRGIDHHTRLFISFDAPQEGAYVPLGALNILDWLPGFLSRQDPPQVMPKMLATAVTMISCPAAEQMLTLDPYSGGVYNSGFFDELAGIGGYPTKLRKIGITNGSMTGNSQGIGDGKQIFDWHPDWGKEYIPFLWMHIYACEILGQFSAWELPLATATNFTITDILVKCGIFSKDGENITSTNTTGPIDNSPGSFSDHINLLVSDLNAANPNVASTVSSAVHSYIPTMSSLDARYPHEVGYFLFDQSSLYSTDFSHSPFDKIFGGSSNTFHVDMWDLIDKDNGKYIFWEVLQNEAMEDNLYLQNRTIASGSSIDFEATQTISAGNNVTTYFTAGPFIVASGASVNMRAGHTIAFEDGYSATGASHAYINPFPICTWPSSENHSKDKTSAKEATVVIPVSAATLKVYPNPASSRLVVQYELPEQTLVKITIYNVLGSEVGRPTENTSQFQGEHILNIDIPRLPAGSYCVVMETPSYTISKRFQIIR